MRKRRLTTALVLCLALSGSMAAMATRADAAPDIQQQVTQALESFGFEIVAVHRTLLGRVRIVAENAEMRREIVFNPHTGEVLRDYSSAIYVPGVATRGERDRDAGRPRATTATPPAVSAMEAVTDPVSGAVP